MQDFLDKTKQTYSLKGLLLSFVLGAVCAILLWFLFFWL